ncbi:MAG: hypothetical protein AVDCRST_MAG79-781, partial [uncultured Thermoleophilia bacterium]
VHDSPTHPAPSHPPRDRRHGRSGRRRPECGVRHRRAVDDPDPSTRDARRHADRALSDGLRHLQEGRRPLRGPRHRRDDPPARLRGRALLARHGVHAAVPPDDGVLPSPRPGPALLRGQRVRQPRGRRLRLVLLAGAGQLPTRPARPGAGGVEGRVRRRRPAGDQRLWEHPARRQRAREPRPAVRARADRHRGGRRAQPEARPRQGEQDLPAGAADRHRGDGPTVRPHLRRRELHLHVRGRPGDDRSDRLVARAGLAERRAARRRADVRRASARGPADRGRRGREGADLRGDDRLRAVQLEPRPRRVVRRPRRRV